MIYIIRTDKGVMNLTRNERDVLMALNANGGATDVEISRTLDLTPSAVGKIRKRLERAGIIKGYRVVLDHKALGVHVFALALVRVRDKGWSLDSGMPIEEMIDGTPNIVKAYRVTDDRLSHIFLFAFRNSYESDRFFQHFQSQNSRYIGVEKLFLFSPESLKKDDDSGLMAKHLEEWGAERTPTPIYLEDL